MFKILPLILFLFSSLAFAEDDSIMAKQRTECEKNSAREWSSQYNRCVDKVETSTYRQDSIECNKISNLDQRKACQIQLAEKETAVSDDLKGHLKEIKGNSTQSALVNSAYAITGLLNLAFVKGGPNSNCNSRKILYATATAGMISDFLMKKKMKKKVDELKDKYSITKTMNGYEAQYKALEYLKEEQQLVKDIANDEAKRQMLLTMGYSAAAIAGFLEANSLILKCLDDPSKAGTQNKETPPNEQSPTAAASGTPAPGTSASGTPAVKEPATGATKP